MCNVVCLCSRNRLGFSYFFWSFVPVARKGYCMTISCDSGSHCLNILHRSRDWLWTNNASVLFRKANMMTVYSRGTHLRSSVGTSVLYDNYWNATNVKYMLSCTVTWPGRIPARGVELHHLGAADHVAEDLRSSQLELFTLSTLNNKTKQQPLGYGSTPAKICQGPLGTH